MSIEVVKAFMEKVKADTDLQSELQAIAPGDKDAALAKVVRVASEAGFSFSAEDYEAAAPEIAQARHAAGDLSDEDLDAVAGGAELPEISSVFRKCLSPDPGNYVSDMPLRSGSGGKCGGSIPIR